MRKFVIVFLLLCVISCSNERDMQSNSSYQTSKSNKSKSLSIGSIAVTYKYEEIIYRPIIQYLVKKMGKYGYTEAKSVIVGTMAELIEKANNDEVDIFFGSLYPTITVDQKSKLEPILKAYENGMDHYYSVFFTRNDSEIDDLSNINGSKVVFENKFSTSGFFYPSIVLKKLGYKLKQYNSPFEKPDKDVVGYSFSSDDGNTVFWILNNNADIGVTHNDDYDYFSDERRSDLKIIHTSKKLLRNIISVRKDIPKEEKDFLIQTLIEMTEDDEGRKIINQFLHITNFEFIDKQNYLELRDDFENYLLK